MSYVEKTLTQGEKVRHHAKAHWMTFVWPSAALAILVYAGPGDTPVVYGLFFVLLLLFALSGLIAYLTTELAVTNKKVVGKWGLVSRTTIEQRLDKVDSISVQQSILGRLFGYGTVTVNGSGLSASPARFISSPLAYRRAVQEAVEAVGKD
ncbi:PH domain-containing protein [Rhodobacter calidifons]|uniref:PH domain-containing protein n=1 Tax=Rhodobacter calidifons TaxID=2715277 RepID=A0ABX0G6Q7_9RHOB|nr:PH domain-containing protein [Rhodobacter calidifons]NHB76544.1 PH domain-containing protein [Rhodobacter calidifons]